MNTLFRSAALCGLFAVSACGQLPAMLRPAAPAEPPAEEAVAPLDATGGAVLNEEVRAVVSAPAPSRAARTADEFDTTTPEQRQQAQSADSGSGTRLGETVASLGDPTRPGLWIRSPLVKTAGPGRLENPANGKTALVELIPLEGAESGGSQVSLAALRLLDAPITDLPVLVVYAN